MKKTLNQHLQMLVNIRKHELFAPIISAIALFSASSILSPNFITLYNQKILLVQASPLALLALGESMIIVMGSIDLSPGSVTALSGLVSAMLIKYYSIAPPIGILLGILTGSLIGAINGLLVVKAKIFSFVATLASLVACRGLVFILTGGKSITGLIEFRFLSREVTGLQVMVWIAIFLAVVHYITLRRMSIGLMMYAIGGNEEAARYSAINADGIKFLAFTLAGTYYGLAGQFMNARLEMAYTWTGWGYELDAIASCVLGGISLVGGSGNPLGPFIGSYLLTIVANIFVLLGVDPYWQWVVKGIILVGAATTITRGLRYVK